MRYLLINRNLKLTVRFIVRINVGAMTVIESHNMTQYNCSHTFSRDSPAPGQIVSCEDTHPYSQSFDDLKDGEKCDVIPFLR